MLNWHDQASRRQTDCRHGAQTLQRAGKQGMQSSHRILSLPAVVICYPVSKRAHGQKRRSPARGCLPGLLPDFTTARRRAHTQRAPQATATTRRRRSRLAYVLACRVLRSTECYCASRPSTPSASLHIPMEQLLGLSPSRWRDHALLAFRSSKIVPSVCPAQSLPIMCG